VMVITPGMSACGRFVAKLFSPPRGENIDSSSRSKPNICSKRRTAKFDISNSNFELQTVRLPGAIWLGDNNYTSVALWGKIWCPLRAGAGYRSNCVSANPSQLLSGLVLAGWRHVQ
jgi:hypothetical protein